MDGDGWRGGLSVVKEETVKVYIYIYIFAICVWYCLFVKGWGASEAPAAPVKVYVVKG